VRWIDVLITEQRMTGWTAGLLSCHYYDSSLERMVVRRQNSIQMEEHTLVNVTMHHCWIHAEGGQEVTARAVPGEFKTGHTARSLARLGSR
jgi:hypothetical protein